MSDTTVHPTPSGSWFDQFVAGDGKTVINAFCDSNIGVSFTTPTHLRRTPNGKWEARVGFAIFGGSNFTEEQFKACGHNPFHPEFHDNYASVFGDSEEAALKALAADLKRLGDSLWE